MKKYFKKIYKTIMIDEMRILPGNIAFFLILSIMPIITLIGIIGSFFSLSMSDVITFLEELIPKDVSTLLYPFLSSKTESNHIMFMLVGIIVASNGPHAIILASNTLYGVENSDFVKRRIKSFFLTILLMNLFFFILVFLAFGNIILKFILELEMFKNISKNIYYLFAILKWPVAFMLIFIFVKILYTLAPDKRIKSKLVNRGASFTTVGWVLVTAIYSYYANNLANYNALYGSLSGIVVLMMWIYIISYIFVIGIIINTNEYKRLEENTSNKLK